MTKRTSNPASAKIDTNWKIDGSEISTKEERTQGLEREGNSQEIENILLSQGFIQGPDGMTIKVESNTVKKDAKGNVVERRTGDGQILTSTEREER